MATNLIAKLREIDPEIATALNQGWDTALDCSAEAFDPMQARTRRVIHNVCRSRSGSQTGKQAGLWQSRHRSNCWLWRKNPVSRTETIGQQNFVG
jgi:hypothetical protein